MVQEILNKSGDNTPLGETWVGQFMKRHKEVRNAIPCPILINCHLAIEDETIQHSFNYYKT